MPGSTWITIDQETASHEHLLAADPPPPLHRVIIAGIRLAEIYRTHQRDVPKADALIARLAAQYPDAPRSEEHTSELQSHHDLVCRLLLEKKKHQTHPNRRPTRRQAGRGPPSAYHR